MLLIEKISNMIEDEMDDAERYIQCAMKWKEERPALAQTFARISNEEMGHMNLLHDQVTAIIMEYRKEHGEPPEKMQGIYDYLHRKHIDRANEIKVQQALFNQK